jgi:hypothetical protein
MEEERMRTISTRVGLALATVTLLCATALSSSAQAALNPFVTVEDSCDVQVAVGQRICVQYGYNPTAGEPQRAIGRLTVQKGNNVPVTIFNGEVFAGIPNELCDVVGTGPENRIVRFTVQTATGATETVSCGYIVRSQAQTQPVVTTSLLLNRQSFVECGASVPSGATVHLVFSSSQSGVAEVSIQKEGGSPTLLARGSVSAGVRYAVGVIAGAADGLTRTFTVSVTNANGTGTATCAYIVP